MDMEQIIDKLAARLQHKLNIEARVGSSTPNRVIADDAESPIKPDRMKSEEAALRLLRLLDHEEQINNTLYQVRRTLAERRLPDRYELLLQLAEPDVLWYFADNEDEEDVIEFSRREVAELLALLVSVSDKVAKRQYEIKRILSGHFASPAKPGRPPMRRGREIAADLLGYAEGYGLPITGDRLKDGIGSAVEAIQKARKKVQVPSDPAAKVVFEQMPSTPSAIENLSGDCAGDEVLESIRATGRRLAQRDLENPDKLEN